MAFDNSYNFSYTGTTQEFTKKIGVTSLYIIAKGAGGGGNAYSSSGGGGAYVFSNYTFLQEDISYNLKVNVGGGGKPPPLQNGGVTLGGSNQSNGGSGTTLQSLSSGGGGGNTNVSYMDPNGNLIINVIAGGGGGAGNNINTTGGHGGRIGDTGYGAGGGQGGNTSLTGNAGLGGINGGVNGFKYVDSSNNNGQNYVFIGGGGGSGGTFAGGGGGSGYGGGAGGKQGGGGGGGSFSTANFISYISGGGGAGGGIGQPGENGSIRFLWNEKPLIVPDPIVNMFMLNTQHTNKSIYRGPSFLPTSVLTYSTIVSSNPNSAVINGDNEIYIISGDGSLYAFNHDFTLRWRYVITDYQFVGTPIIGDDNTIYISSKTNLPTKYFYALVDNVVAAGLKWRLNLINGGNCITSPIIDISQNIYVGTDNGLVYKINDGTVNGGIGWNYPAIGNTNVIVSGTPVIDISNTKICFTTYNSTTSTSTINMIDLSANANFNSLNLMWSKTINDTDISGNYLTPSIRGNESIYVNTTKGHVYAYDVSSNSADEIWNPIYINDVSLSAIAVGSNDKLYFSSKNSFNMIDSSNGILEWKYYIDASSAIVSNNSIPTIDSNDNVYVGTRNNYLHHFKPLEHKCIWKYKAGGSIQSTPVIDNYEHIFFGANDGKIYDMSGNGPEILPTTPVVPMYMLDVRHTGVSQYTGPTTQPSKIWNTPAPFVSGNLFVSPSISIGSTGILYLGSNDGYVYSINSINGSQIWKTQVNNTNRAPFTSPNSIYTTPVIGTDGTIYVGSNEGYLYALREDGTIKFSYNAGYPLQSSPIIDSSNNIYFGAGNSVYSIGDSEYKGYSRWINPFDTSANVNSSPALGQNRWLYFGSDDGYVYAIDSLTGFYKWHYNATTTLPNRVHPIYGSPAIDSYNNVCIGNGSDMSGVLHYIDGLTGNAIWTNSYDDMIGPFYNTPAINGDTIYLSTIAYVYAINRTDGVVKWRYFNTNAYYTSPIIDSNGKLFFASIRGRDYIEGDDNNEITWRKNDGLLHCLTDNGNTYTSNWIYKISSKSRLAPPVLGTDGTIYISATDNNIYAIK